MPTKKGILILTLLLISFISFTNIDAEEVNCGDGFSLGSGTSGDPYQITTPAELAVLNNCLGVENADKYFVLSDQIDLDTAPYNTGNGWPPLGTGTGNQRFFGTLDGDSNSIINLTINSDSESGFVGLFGGLAGTVKNLILESVTITFTGTSGDAHVGSIAGYSTGTIMNVSTQGAIDATGSYVGGVVGLLDTGGVVYETESRFEIIGYNPKVGGIAGENRGGIDTSFALVYLTGSGDSNSSQYGGIAGSQYGATASTTNTHTLYSPFLNSFVSGDSKIGGLIGYLQSGSVTDTYSVAAVTSVSEGGGLIGKKESSATVTNSFWDTTIAGSVSDGGTGKTTPQMKEWDTFSDWNFLNTWWIDSEGYNGYPFFQWFDSPSFGDIVHYKAGSNGTLSGTELQNLTSRDPDGTPVTAVPDSGYVFSSWSDDSTSNPRTDTYGSGDRLITANFSAEGGGGEEETEEGDGGATETTPPTGTNSSRRAANIKSLFGDQNINTWQNQNREYVLSRISQIQQILSLLLRIRDLLNTQ